MSTMLARVKSAVLTETKSNKEYVAVDFETVDTPKRVYQWSGWFGEDYGKDNKSKTQRTFEALRCAGWKGDDVSDLSSMIGTECDITVKAEEYNGVTQVKVAFINLPGEGGFKAKPLEKSKAKNFARSLAAEARSIKAPISSTPNGSHPNAPGNNSGPPDDVEF